MKLQTNNASCAQSFELLKVGAIKPRNINKYLKLEAEGLEGFFTGQILCIVALICWYLMVAKEAGRRKGCF